MSCSSKSLKNSKNRGDVHRQGQKNKNKRITQILLAKNKRTLAEAASMES
jgi:hypothetical protein